MFKPTHHTDFFVTTPPIAKMNDDQRLKEFEKHFPSALMSGISGEWANALFIYGGVHNARDQILDDLNRVIKEDLSIFDPAVQTTQPIAQLAKQFDSHLTKEKFHPQTKLFLLRLLEKNQLWLLPKISAKYFEAMNELKGIVEGLIWSAKPMTKEEFDEAIRYSQNVYLRPDQTLRAELRVDPGLISGWQLRVQNQIYGTSLQDRITDLKQYFQSEVDLLNNAMERSIRSV